eukprot:s3702_g1.t1
MDVNGDGVLSREEFVAAMRKRDAASVVQRGINFDTVNGHAWFPLVAQLERCLATGDSSIWLCQTGHERSWPKGEAQSGGGEECHSFRQGCRQHGNFRKNGVAPDRKSPSRTRSRTSSKLKLLLEDTRSTASVLKRIAIRAMAAIAAAAKLFAIACCAAAVNVGTKQAKSQASPTVAPPMLLECGSSVTDSTSGAPDLIGNANGDGSFLFCPNTTGLAQISTCDSNVNTWLYIRGPGIDFSCDDCGDCRIASRAEGSLSFVAGECYEVFVEAAEGEYTISITCTYETVTANNTCPIYAVGNDIPSELRRFADSVTVRDRVADFEAALSDGLAPQSQVLLDLGSAFNLEPDTLTKLNRSILQDGVHLVMFRDGRVSDLVGSRFFTRSCDQQVQELQLAGSGSKSWLLFIAAQWPIAQTLVLWIFGGYTLLGKLCVCV